MTFPTSFHKYLSALLIVVLSSQVIAYSNVVSTSEESKGGNFMMVELEHRNSEGVLLDTICIKDDLLLRNFAYWLAVQGAGNDYIEAGSTYRAKATDGSLVTYTLAKIDFLATDAFVSIGTGVTAPVITDYVLETPVMDEFIVDRLYWSSGTQFNLTIDGLFLFSAPYAITEIGLGVGLETKDVLVARDTFTAINVIAGDTLTTRYYLLVNWSP